VQSPRPPLCGGGGRERWIHKRERRSEREREYRERKSGPAGAFIEPDRWVRSRGFLKRAKWHRSDEEPSEEIVDELHALVDACARAAEAELPLHTDGSGKPQMLPDFVEILKVPLRA